MASAYLTTGNLSTAGNQKKWTFSAWIKKATTGTNNGFMSYWSTSANYFTAKFTSADRLQFGNVDAGAWTTELVTNAIYRDTSAYYHIVYHYNSAEATSSNRAKLWVNGEQITSFNTEQYPSQNANTKLPNSGYPLLIGVAREGTNYRYLDGVMTHVHFCDGYAYEASDFGETDSTTGIWKPITSPSVSYGTNGFFLDFADSSNFGNDVSGQNNDLSVGGGTITQTIDTPSNVFATFNTNIRSNATFTNGNTTYTSPSSNPVFGSLTNLGASSGKYYAECKYSAGSNHYLILGIADYNFSVLGGLGSSSSDDLGKNGTTGSIAYVVNTGAYRVNNSNTSWGDAGGDGDILMMAMDCDNKKVYFGRNGTWGNSSNPATNTNGIDVTSILTGDEWFFGVTNDTGSSETVAQFNFGNGYFGTTAVSSAGTNSGIGTFEYDVPSGYKALCTKNINEQEYS